MRWLALRDGVTYIPLEVFWVSSVPKIAHSLGMLMNGEKGYTTGRRGTPSVRGRASWDYNWLPQHTVQI